MELQNNATTVFELAAHMDRLRERAVVFHRDFATGDRGYFTPSEDEAVLALWVIIGRDDEEEPAEEEE